MSLEIKHICLVPVIVHSDVFSAGEEWTENPETYESSFYKRTLDNDIYIFTAPSFNSEFSEMFEICVHTLLFVRLLSVAWHCASPSLGPWILSLFLLCLSVIIPSLPVQYTSCYLH